MIRAILHDAGALAALALFAGMLLIWAAILHPVPL